VPRVAEPANPAPARLRRNPGPGWRWRLFPVAPSRMNAMLDVIVN